MVGFGKSAFADCQKAMRIIAALLAFSVAGLSAVTAGTVRSPHIRANAPYSEARQQLLADGWTPIRTPRADPCPGADTRCVGRPEMEFCASTKTGECLFIWSREDTTVAVFTTGRPEAIVGGIMCRSGCR